MNQSSNAEHFFQTDSSISESSRKFQKSKNNAGNPIRLPSKLLSVIPDPFAQDGGVVYVAEAAGTVKRVVLETKEVSHILRPTTTASPITTLAIHISPGTNNGTLFAGSWDKCIHIWPIASGLPASVTSTDVLKGHTDFIKALLVIPAMTKEGDALLVSASADKSIIVWNVRTKQRIHTLLGHARGVLSLALDPLSLPDLYPSSTTPENPDGQEEQRSLVIASGDSNREIRFWRISIDTATEITTRAAALETTDSTDPRKIEEMDEEDLVLPLLVHETSVFSLHYTPSGTLYTASADRTAKSFIRRSGTFEIDSVFQHGDYVKAVVVAEHAGGLVVTAGRDEDVRVWDSTSGTCVAVLRGHWEEVTALAVVAGGRAVVSVGIDGTIRRWGLSLHELNAAVQMFEVGDKVVEEEKKSLLTEEEERELAELMDDDD